MARLAAVSLAVAVLASACAQQESPSSSDATPTPTATPAPGVIDVTGNISGDETWETGSTHRLRTYVFVESGTLTLEAGAVVLGDPGTALLITRNARIDAQGTSSKPVIFTSSADLGDRKAGDWGGVVLLGNAALNVAGGESVLADLPPAQAALSGFGGGASPDAAHDCGSLRYVRIEFSGYEIPETGKRLSGLVAAACGSATAIDFVEVHRGANDGVEVIGGSVDLKHVVITRVEDDGIDWSLGWTGRAQFVVVQQASDAGDNGIEADNNDDDKEAEPRSNPLLYNLTLLGSDSDPGLAAKHQAGLLLQRGTAGRIHDSLITRFADCAADIEGTSAAAQADAGELTIADSIFYDNANLSNAWPAETDDDGGLDEEGLFGGGSLDNRFVDPGLPASAMDEETPDFGPATSSPALSGAAGAPDDGFFENVDFVGAVGSADWTQGWTYFPKN